MAGFERQNIPRYLTGAVAVGLALYCLVHNRRDPAIFFSSVFFTVICLTDTLRSRIPNWAVTGLIIAGFGLQIVLKGTSGFISAGEGLLLGLLLLLGPYIMGGMGAGDVKALAALGSLLGPADTLQVFLYAGLFGGAMALMHYAMAGRLLEKIRKWGIALLLFSTTRKTIHLPQPDIVEKLRYPYAAAFAFGYYGYLAWGNLV
jgi:prepilin peptidase CpaA